MPNQKKFTPNSILDVKQYLLCDFDDGFVLSDPRFVKIFKSCKKVNDFFPEYNDSEKYFHVTPPKANKKRYRTQQRVFNQFYNRKNGWMKK